MDDPRDRRRPQVRNRARRARGTPAAGLQHLRRRRPWGQGQDPIPPRSARRCATNLPRRPTPLFVTALRKSGDHRCHVDRDGHGPLRRRPAIARHTLQRAAWKKSLGATCPPDRGRSRDGYHQRAAVFPKIARSPSPDCTPRSSTAAVCTSDRDSSNCVACAQPPTRCSPSDLRPVLIVASSVVALVSDVLDATVLVASLPLFLFLLSVSSVACCCCLLLCSSLPVDPGFGFGVRRSLMSLLLPAGPPRL